MGTGQKSPPDKKPSPPNNEIIIQCTIVLHLFYIDGDIKRYLKELIQKINYFKNIFPQILIIVIFIYRV